MAENEPGILKCELCSKLTFFHDFNTWLVEKLDVLFQYIEQFYMFQALPFNWCWKLYYIINNINLYPGKKINPTKILVPGKKSNLANLIFIAQTKKSKNCVIWMEIQISL